MDLHKGSVAATSAGLGCGSSFSITLPVLTRRRATESRVVTAVTAPVASSRSFRTKPQLLKSVSKAWERSFRFLASDVSHTFGHKSVSKSRVLPVSSSDYGDKEEEEEEEGDNLRTTCANGEDNSVMSFRYVGEEDGRHTGNGTLLLSRVLIVDDVSMNRKMLRRVLERSCGAMDEAEDGDEAVARVRQVMREEGGLMYDLILLDFQMPNMDGPTAARHMRAMGYEGLIIGVTGNGLPADVETFISSGANRVLLKPVNAATILTAISAELSKKT